MPGGSIGSFKSDDLGRETEKVDGAVNQFSRSQTAVRLVTGERWNRPDDTVGVAGVVNGISGAHEAYVNAGGLGILIGDGMLPNPGPEQIIETYYSLPVSSWKVTLEYQFIMNPGYNRDRGPVFVIGARLDAQF